jgi:hypothetical protein
MHEDNGHGRNEEFVLQAHGWAFEEQVGVCMQLPDRPALARATTLVTARADLVVVIG